MTNEKDTQISSKEGLSPRAISGADKNGFLFAFPLLKQRLQLLQRLVNDGEFLTLVVGDHASGKSMLIRYLLKHNKGKWQPCRVRIHPKVSAHIPSLVKNLRNLSAFMLENKRQYVLILDDAHYLSLGELQHFIRAAQVWESNIGRIGIVLLGEPPIKQLVDRLADRLPPNTAVTTLYMPALTEEQTKAYLRRWTQTQRHLGGLQFSDKQIRTIYQVSGGLPGLINREAINMLDGLKGKGEKKRKEWGFLKKRMFKNRITFLPAD